MPLWGRKMVHGLRDCIEQHWLEDDFVILKVDLKNVSHQAVLTEHAKHFPELLPWANWCYGDILVGCLTSELVFSRVTPLVHCVLFAPKHPGVS